MEVLLMTIQGDVLHRLRTNGDLTGTLCYRKWRRATQTSYSCPGTWSHPLKLQGGYSCQPSALAAQALTSDSSLLNGRTW